MAAPDGVAYEYIHIQPRREPIIVGRIYGYAGPRHSAVVYEYVFILV